MEMAAPRRAKLRKDKEDPNWKKSNNASEDPIREMPNTARVLPSFSQLLNDSEAPT
jgi:hypothetical protein